MRPLLPFIAALFAWAAVPAQAAIVTTTASGILDSYTGQAYVTPPPFLGDPATLTSLDFRVSGLLNERMTVQGGDGAFVLNYGARFFGQTVYAATSAVSVTLGQDGSGSVTVPFSMAFSAPVILVDPELEIDAWLSPAVGFFPSDGSHFITGRVNVTAIYDPPDPVPEPPTLLLLATLSCAATAAQAGGRHHARAARVT